MNIRRLYLLGKRKHEFGFRGMIVAVLLVGFMPGGIALFAYEGWKQWDITWVIAPVVFAIAIAAIYSAALIISARKSERDLFDFKLRLMGRDRLAERIADQARWNPEAKEAWERFCAKAREEKEPNQALQPTAPSGRG
jgi:hypothetical protein